MSGLFGTLSATSLALASQSRALDISGKNLANVNNPDYSRERVKFGSTATIQTAQGAESLGLQVLAVEQLRDNLLDQEVARESGLSAALTATQAGYQRAQAGLGENLTTASATGASSLTDTGIASALDGFFNSFQNLAANPTDTGARQAVLDDANALTTEIQSTDQRLAQVQSDLGTQVSSDVTAVNTILQSIAALNGQIARYESGNPGGAVDLRDQRQAQIELLAAKIPVQVTSQPHGEVQVATKGANNSAVVLVDLGNVIGTVAFNGTTVTAGPGATPVALTSGSIAGAINARDGGIQTLRNQINALAAQTVTAVNQAYNPTGTTGDFFAASGNTAATIAVNPALTTTNLKASDGGPAGDNTVALAVAAVAHHVFAKGSGDQIDGTLGGAFSSSVTQFGSALATVNTQVTNQASIEKLVRAQRDTVSGVSMDEEVSDLTKYQRAFQASSRVFTIIDNLLNTVVTQMGV